MSGFANIIPTLTISDAAGSTGIGIGTIASLSFALGFALNRGSICTVIATADLVKKRRPGRSIALLESALWASLIYAIIEISPYMPEGWLPFGYLVLGTVLFALGSYVNSACVFGSVGHFGNGHVEFAWVFIGIFIATYVEPFTGLLPPHPPQSNGMPESGLAILFILLLLIGIRFTATRADEETFALLTLTMAMTGLSFALLAAITPQFSITASIKTLVSLPVAGAVAIAGTAAGSIASALTSGRSVKLEWPTWRGSARHLAGGLLMGMGAILIPGGNDTLLLVGLPGVAWQAFTSYALLVILLAGLIAAFDTRIHTSP